MSILSGSDKAQAIESSPHLSVPPCSPIEYPYGWDQRVSMSILSGSDKAQAVERASEDSLCSILATGRAPTLSGFRGWHGFES
ncbi:hypothetical protein RRG08_025876 [Elysia crispata]|uniref:Uncharacterized protein n=1 Tax=Elysia crispata TaxID=231223 RepID=A0AAE0ZPI1_9GAST|nr:hypothetical protein RRG08_025876 [Elysia crispata]